MVNGEVFPCSKGFLKKFVGQKADYKGKTKETRPYPSIVIPKNFLFVSAAARRQGRKKVYAGPSWLLRLGRWFFFLTPFIRAPQQRPFLTARATGSRVAIFFPASLFELRRTRRAKMLALRSP